MLHAIYSISGLLAIIMCLFSEIFRSKLFLTDSLVAMLFGLFLKLLTLEINSLDFAFELEFARICVGLQVMTTGINMPDNYFKKNLKTQAMMLLPIMTIGWLICSGIVMIIPDMHLIDALMIGACIAPTDPILANSVTTGHFAEKYVPAALRDLLSFESGANDGLGYPFLFLPIYLATLNVGTAIGKWFLITILLNIIVSVIIGIASGYVLNILCKWTQKESHMSLEYLEIFTVAISIFLLGIVGAIGSDDILAVFTCGVVFNRDGFLYKEWNLDFAEGVDTLLNVAFFLYLGNILPIDKWLNSDLFSIGHLFVIAILVLLFKRLPVVLLYKFIPAIRTWKEAFFIQWFGPMGVSSIFYTLVLLENTKSEIAYPLVTFVVFCSVIVHGLSVPLIILSSYVSKWLRIPCSLLWDPLIDAENEVVLAIN
eukprot:NODE_388_length_8234_cov_1.030731.p3 type:complete len:427 gc:universal NODE_388_length_8234_cov_1.030731:1998-718(-)